MMLQGLWRLSRDQVLIYTKIRAIRSGSEL